MKWYDEYSLNSIFLYYSLFNLFLINKKKISARRRN